MKISVDLTRLVQRGDGHGNISDHLLVADLVELEQLQKCTYTARQTKTHVGQAVRLRFGEFGTRLDQSRLLHLKENGNGGSLPESLRCQLTAKFEKLTEK